MFRSFYFGLRLPVLPIRYLLYWIIMPSDMGLIDLQTSFWYWWWDLIKNVEYGFYEPWDRFDRDSWVWWVVFSTGFLARARELVINILEYLTGFSQVVYYFCINYSKKLTKLIKANDVQGIEDVITNQAVWTLLELLLIKAGTYGVDPALLDGVRRLRIRSNLKL